MKSTCRLSNLIAMVLLACLFAAGSATAAPPGGWVPVQPDRLEDMRGGFTGHPGLVISFGLDRVVRVNGEVVLSTHLRIPDVARMSAEDAAALARLRDTQVVSIGGTVASRGGGALLIQNTLDGQHVSALTSLDVSLNTLRLYRDTQLGALINGAVIAGLP